MERYRLLNLTHDSWEDIKAAEGAINDLARLGYVVRASQVVCAVIEDNPQCYLHVIMELTRGP
jgi:hypothetical protein